MFSRRSIRRSSSRSGMLVARYARMVSRVACRRCSVLLLMAQTWGRGSSDVMVVVEYEAECCEEKKQSLNEITVSKVHRG